MIMIFPNSFAQQKEGVQREGEEEVGDKKREAKQEPRRKMWMLQQVYLDQGC